MQTGALAVDGRSAWFCSASLLPVPWARLGRNQLVEQPLQFRLVRRLRAKRSPT